MDVAGGDRVAIGLGPTRGQLVDAFVWVALGLACGLFIALSTVVAGGVSRGAVVLGLLIVALALTSLVLEFRALPGAVITIGDGEVVVVPRRGGQTRFPLRQVGGIRLDPPAGQAPGPAPRRRRGTRRPSWQLTVLPTAGSGALIEVGVGADAGRVVRLRQACGAAGLRFESAS